MGDEGKDFRKQWLEKRSKINAEAKKQADEEQNRIKRKQDEKKKADDEEAKRSELFYHGFHVCRNEIATGLMKFQNSISPELRAEHYNMQKGDSDLMSHLDFGIAVTELQSDKQFHVKFEGKYPADGKYPPECEVSAEAAGMRDLNYTVSVYELANFKSVSEGFWNWVYKALHLWAEVLPPDLAKKR